MTARPLAGWPPYGTTACSQPVRMLQISAISLGTGG